MASEPTASSFRSKDRTRLVLPACILASSLVGMDGLMTTVALPAMAAELNAGLSLQQWIIAAFLLALGALILVGGALGDIYGRRRVLVAGTAGFGLAALVCALAPSAPLLIVGRLVQGAAAALLIPSVLAVLSVTFEGERRSKAIATWSAWSGLSVLAAPLVGGLLIDVSSWRAIYWLELPCAALVVLLVVRATAVDVPAFRTSVDLGGAVLAAAAVGGPAYFLIQGPQVGWTSPGVLAALAGGLVSLAAFPFWERRARNPLLPLSLFKRRTFTVLNVVTFVLYGGLISCGTYTILFLQDNLGYAPAAAGIAGAVPIVLLFMLSSRFGALADRYGGRAFVAAGSAVAGVGMLLLLRVEPYAAFTTVILPSVLVHGVGLSMLVAPLTSGVMSAAPADRVGVASGINNAIARTGSMLAIAVVGVVISSGFSARLESGLDGERLSPAVGRAMQQARQRPFSGTLAGGTLTPDERVLVDSVLAEASVDAFRLGVAVMGGLALLAAALAFIGLRERSAPLYDAAGTIGCPITGVRTHPDAAPIGSRAIASRRA